MKAVSWEDRDGLRWIQLEGDLDAAVAGEIQEDFLEAVQEVEGDVVVMLEGVPFMASAGIALLIRGLKLLKDRGYTMKIAGMRQSLRDILRTTNLIDLFEEFEAA